MLLSNVKLLTKISSVIVFFFPMKDLSKVFLVNVSVGQVLPLGIWLLIQDCVKSHMAHSVLH